MINAISSFCSSVEISQSLAKKQLQTVGEVQSHLSKFRVERRDATDRSGWGKLVIFHDPFSSWGKFCCHLASW